MKNIPFFCRFTVFSLILGLSGILPAAVMADYWNSNPLVGYWSFDNDSGGVVADSANFVGLGIHNGTLLGTNNTYHSVTGESGSGAKLTGGNYLQFGSGGSVQILNSASGDAGYRPTFDFVADDFSISFWFKANASTPTGWTAMVAKNLDAGYAVRTRGGVKEVTFSVAGGGTGAFDPVTGIDIYDQQWHQVTAVYGDGKRYIYIDGVEKFTDARTANANSAPGSLFIGAQANNNRCILSAMDDVAIFRGALSADQAAQLAAGTAAGSLSFANAPLDYNITAGVLDPSGWYAAGGVRDFRASSYVNGTFVAAGTKSSNGDISGANDGIVTTLWGPQFEVLDVSKSVTFDVGGGASGLTLSEDGKSLGSSRIDGGVGATVWNITANDYVRKPDGTIYTVTNSDHYGTSGNSGNDAPTTHTLNFSEMGNVSAGDQLMFMAVDRRTGGWGWTSLGNITAARDAIQGAAGAHHLVTHAYDFDTANDRCGWQEYDADGITPRADTELFILGRVGNNGNPPVGYIDLLGRDDTKTKGMISTSGIPGNTDLGSGILRSPTFLSQADILEFYICGGYASDGVSLQLVDAEKGTVLYQADGNRIGTLGYDFTGVAEWENKPVYLQIVNERDAYYGHIELDQLRMVDFQPSDAKVAAKARALANPLAPSSTDPTAVAEAEAVFNVYAWNAAGVTDLASMGAFLGTADTADAVSAAGYGTLKFKNEALAGDTDGNAVVLRAETMLEVPYSGFYTFAVLANNGFALSLEGEELLSGERAGGASEPYLATVFFDEAGWYDLSLDYFDIVGMANLELYGAVGDYDENSWDAAAFSLIGDGNFLGQLYGFDILNVAPLDAPSGSGVPEPATWLMLLLGTAGVLWMRKRRIGK